MARTASTYSASWRRCDGCGWPVLNSSTSRRSPSGTRQSTVPRTTCTTPASSWRNAIGTSKRAAGEARARRSVSSLPHAPHQRHHVTAEVGRLVDGQQFIRLQIGQHARAQCRIAVVGVGTRRASGAPLDPSPDPRRSAAARAGRRTPMCLPAARSVTRPRCTRDASPAVAATSAPRRSPVPRPAPSPSVRIAAGRWAHAHPVHDGRCQSRRHPRHPRGRPASPGPGLPGRRAPGCRARRRCGLCFCAAALRYSRSRARVTATYISRLLSSRSRTCSASVAPGSYLAMPTMGSSPLSPATTRNGGGTPPVPRVMFTRNTIGNSSPLDACTVIRLTASAASMAALDSSPADTRSM